ncbi:MAG: glycosyltransferase [Sphingobacterium sp.]|uniref:glycosyltransferase n=1 Tax=Sphingobacterium sp. TaxID=341027 RepID=UPI0028234836|nr:glycosyltransferase family 2 protein [Sphingobacterium sp.]MDR0261996.1 glycosyltransferase [Sphingobacterium sp.]
METLIFIPFLVWVMYFFVFSVGYRVPKKLLFARSPIQHRFLIIFPAYKEDAVIVDSIQSFLRQDYPKDLYEIVVVSDSMSGETNEELQRLGVRVLIPEYKKRSKAAALNLTMSVIREEDFDGVVILDADNLVFPNYLTLVNDCFAAGAIAVQTHRIAKNSNTDTAYLDGISEEINNSIFRKGHVNLGLPAALTGSGMLFEIKWFKKTMAKISSMGEDKELEYYLLLDKIFTVYLENVYVLDEKVQTRRDLSNQRKRWIAAQIDTFLITLKRFRTIIRTHNWPMLDKLIQWSIPPRIILLGMVPILGCIVYFVAPALAYKWLILYVFFLLSLGLAVPNRFYNRRTLICFLKLPFIFIAILRSFMGIKSGRNTFVHTPHGEKKEDYNH